MFDALEAAAVAAAMAARLLRSTLCDSDRISCYRIQEKSIKTSKKATKKKFNHKKIVKDILTK